MGDTVGVGVGEVVGVGVGEVVGKFVGEGVGKFVGEGEGEFDGEGEGEGEGELVGANVGGSTIANAETVNASAEADAVWMAPKEADAVCNVEVNAPEVIELFNKETRDEYNETGLLKRGNAERDICVIKITVREFDNNLWSWREERGASNDSDSTMRNLRELVKKYT